MSLLLFTSCSTTSMDKCFVICWIVIVDNKLYRRNVKTSCCNISYNQNGSTLGFSEFIKSTGPLIHIHFSINSFTLINFADKGNKVINMIFSGYKNNNFAIYSYFLKDKKESTRFVFWSDNKSIDCHLFRQGNLLMNVAVLSKSNFGKLIYCLIDSSTKHKTLRNWTFLRNLF